MVTVGMLCQSAHSPKERATTPLGLSPRVLVVDDEPTLRRIMARELRNEFDVTLANGLAPALGCLGQEDQLCAVVSDLMMGGPVGLDLLEEVRRRKPQCARILVSGTLLPSDLGNALASGTVQQFVSKPWERGALLMAVRLALDLPVGA